MTSFPPGSMAVRALRLVLRAGLLTLAVGGGSASLVLVLLPDAALGPLPLPGGVGGAAAAHLVAVGSSLVLAHLTAPGASAATDERLAVAATAVLVPVFGPALAWTIPGRTEAVRNAHAAFEDEEGEHGYRRTGRVGDYATDLARETGAISYLQILRQGTLQRRRNLLRSLARLGRPKHVRVIRECLHDDDPELRLCAHAELDRIAQRHEDAIARLRARADEQGGKRRARTLVQLARRTMEYASSGIFDDDMRCLWLEQAVERSRWAEADDPSSDEAVRVRAEALIELGRVDEAREALSGREDGDDLRDLTLLARIAFAERDFDRIRAIAARFDAQFAPVPRWMASLTRPSLYEQMASRPTEEA